MGKTIDRAALHVLAALALYLFFVSAFGNIWLAAGCALCALLLLRKLLLPLAGRLPKREAHRGRARAEVERWAMLDAETAEAEARALLEKAYPGQTAEAELLFLPRHPQGPPFGRKRRAGRLAGAERGKAAAGHHGAGGRDGARLRGKTYSSRRAADRRRAAVRTAYGLPAAEAGGGKAAAAFRHRRFPRARPAQAAVWAIAAGDVPAFGQSPLSGRGACDAPARRAGMEKAARSQAAVQVRALRDPQGGSSNSRAPAGR